MVVIDDRSYIYVDGVKIARLVETDLEFLDRDPERIRQRGTRFVRIGIIALFQSILKEGRIQVKRKEPS